MASVPPLNANIDPTQLPDDAAAGLEGRKAQVSVLYAGERVFKGGSTMRPTGEALDSAQWAVSPWWISEMDYQTVLDEHKRRQGQFMGSLGFILRQAAAVKQRWSRVDVRIKAEVLRDIQVFVAPGRRQDEEFANGMTVVWEGWGDITQIYIPNLNADRCCMGIVYFDGAAVLRVLTQKVILSEQVFGTGGHQ